MRRLPVLGLILSISILVFGPAVQGQQKSPPPQSAVTSTKAQTIADPGGQPPTIDISDTPDPAEFFFFFRHLESLDAAADNAVAEGNPDASQWKSHHQQAAGLTDEQGAIVKEVAYACNQTLSDPDVQIQADATLSGGEPTISTDPPPGRMEIVSAAVDELRSRIGEEPFQALAAYVHATFGSALEAVSGSPGPVPPDITGDPAPPVDAQLVAGEIDVTANISKLSRFELFAMCDTTMDAATARSARCTAPTALSSTFPATPPFKASVRASCPPSRARRIRRRGATICTCTQARVEAPRGSSIPCITARPRRSRSSGA
jgi:hypothetical protein